ncbi:ChaB family protein [Pseudanabaena sp. FACHB-2040]|uniref:ChaB family protein n=1 Tax=Pseudanabaena sp. FACHB-2040 TaxID=2692859 RepID=UPI001682B412|nr:ChaB family protein [Pseudanabaena sp. FACHB-2040]MBD2260098.1 ChaB family protein [Pseudanabaena sp. FACHB-2040]
MPNENTEYQSNEASSQESQVHSSKSDNNVADYNEDVLPQEAQSLPQEAKQIFMAAFKSAVDDGLSEGGAHDVAWSSVRNTFAQDESGEWYFKAERREVGSNTGTMPNS